MNGKAIPLTVDQKSKKLVIQSGKGNEPTTELERKKYRDQKTNLMTHPSKEKPKQRKHKTHRSNRKRTKRTGIRGRSRR